MPEKKPKAYAKSRNKSTTLKAEKEQKSQIREELKSAPPEPKKEEPKLTKGGKEWDIVGEGMMHRIQFKSGGQIPEQLSGVYTKRAFAEQAIEAYEARQR